VLNTLCFAVSPVGCVWIEIFFGIQKHQRRSVFLYDLEFCLIGLRSLRMMVWLFIWLTDMFVNFWFGKSI
jgi:hypothetical protein